MRESKDRKQGLDRRDAKTEHQYITNARFRDYAAIFKDEIVKLT